MADSRSGHPHPAGPYFTVDLHLHTNRGSADSNLAPKEMVARAQAIGIGAICITEHDNIWDLREIATLAADRRRSISKPVRPSSPNGIRFHSRALVVSSRMVDT